MSQLANVMLFLYLLLVAVGIFYFAYGIHRMLDLLAIVAGAQ